MGGEKTMILITQADDYEREISQLNEQIRLLRRAARLSRNVIKENRSMPGPKSCNCEYCKAYRAISIAMKASK